MGPSKICDCISHSLFKRDQQNAANQRAHSTCSPLLCRVQIAACPRVQGCRRWRSIGCRPTELQLFAVVCSIDVCLRPKRPKWSALCRWQMVRNACPTKQKDPLTSYSCRASRIRSERKRKGGGRRDLSNLLTQLNVCSPISIRAHRPENKTRSQGREMLF